MEIIPGLILPLWSIILIISAASGLLILIIIKVFLNYSFLKSCDKSFSDPGKMSEFIKFYKGDKLLKHSRLIEKSVEKNGLELITVTGLDKLWEKQFLIHRRIKYLKKFIKYFPEKGLFFCILGGKNRPVFEKIFNKALLQSSDLNLLRKIAAAGEGTDFDGEYAATLIGDHLQDLVEMSGDAEWSVRFFAIKLLLHYNDSRAVRILWESFNDSAIAIRKAVAAEFKTEESDRLSNILKNLLLDDPSYRVRKAARNRLDADFPEYYRIDTKGLSKSRIIHLLGHLHDGSDEDENTAMDFLLSGDLEIRLQAALYLQQQGSLIKLFHSADAGDSTGYDRIHNLLKKACEVNCTSFLREIETVDNPAAIHLAAVLLKDNGNRRYIDKLASKVFTHSFKERTREHYTEIYRETVKCISLRGSDQALKQLNNELTASSANAERYEIILPLLPLRGESFFIPTLISFLKKGGFSKPELLRETIERFPASMYIEEIVELIRSAPDIVDTAIRKEAFKILGELKMPCCLQVVLENLKLLSHDEQKEFAVILNSYDEAAFEERVTGLLNTCDAETKAALMSALPATGIKTFVKDIRESAKDPDPEVRIAGIWALAGYGENKLISQMTDMLRDPVERVRRETAAVIGSHGSPAAMTELKRIITDKNEVNPVKSAAVYGLGASKRDESINILVDTLEDPELRSITIKALALKTNSNEIVLLIELFKDASPQMREYISEVFKAMGETCESAVTKLLQEDISSLREVLAEILLRTGYIENTVAKLRHRSPAIRKQAAAILALIQTKEAFKGVILAARDPDSEVRVEVLKALEKLNTPEGSPILEELKEDPDKRVRKYTLWALERLEAKNTDAK